jgi:hypothetical protein
MSAGRGAGSVVVMLALACSSPRADLEGSDGGAADALGAVDQGKTIDLGTDASPGEIGPGATGGADGAVSGAGGVAMGTGGASAGTGGAGAGTGGASVDAPVDQPVDLPQAGGASTCPAGAILCEGFEAAQLDTGRWSPFADDGSEVVRDGTRYARGAGSLRLHGSPGRKGELGFGTNLAIPDPAYVRYYIFTGAGTSQHGGGLMTMDDGGAPQKGVDVGWEDTTVDLEGDVVASQPSRALALPHEQWHCLVVKVQMGSPGEMTVTLDGAPSPILSTSITTPVTLRRLMFSQSYDLTSTPGALPFDAWVDEVAVSGTPLHCTD